MTDKRDLKHHIRARQQQTGESYSTARMHVLRAQQQLLGEPDRLEAIILSCGAQSLRLRVVGEQHQVTLRTSSITAWSAFPGQLLELTVKRRWTNAGYSYVSGTVERVWTDLAALGLEPLPLVDRGLDDLSGSEPFLPPDPYAPMWRFFVANPRPAFEMSAIAWDIHEDPADPSPDGGLTCDAAELRAAGLLEDARELLMKALQIDLRCIDAHVHLGAIEFDDSPERAMTHYEIAVGIGELSVGPSFEDTLPWGIIYNRPFLRALHGLGLCHWRLGSFDVALELFTRMLKLNPRDNQGARECWAQVRAREPWRSDAD